MGFHVKSEELGVAGRLDLLVELPEKVDVVMEHKFVHDPKKPTQAQRDQILARLARRLLPTEVRDKELAMSSLSDNFNKAIDDVLSKKGNKHLTGYERFSLIAKTIESLAPERALNKALAQLAEKRLDPKIITAALPEAASGSDSGADQIDKLLAKRAQEALWAITDKEYDQIAEAKRPAEKIVNLGIAASDYCKKIKVIFG